MRSCRDFRGLTATSREPEDGIVAVDREFVKESAEITPKKGMRAAERRPLKFKKQANYFRCEMCVPFTELEVDKPLVNHP